MDPNQNSNYPPSFSFPNQPTPNSNIPRPENWQLMDMQAIYRNPYSMYRPDNPQNLSMQMSYGMQPLYGMHPMYNFPPYNQQYRGGSSYAGTTNISNSDIVPIPQPDSQHFSSGSTDIPEFGSQISLGNVGGDTPTSFLPTTEKSPTTAPYHTWSCSDNITLLQGYFHVSNDSEMGNDQKGKTFWDKITAYVNDKSLKHVERTRQQCISHYRTLNSKIAAWVGEYRRALSMNRSGWSDEDYINKAHELYIEKTGKRFVLIQEWESVRNQPKYMVGSCTSEGSGSKRKSSGDETTSIHLLVRPEGREAAKKKAKGSSSKSTSSRKSKVGYAEEFSTINTEREDIKQTRVLTVSALEKVAASNIEKARAKKMKLWFSLKNKDGLDDEEQQLLNMLAEELFG